MKIHFKFTDQYGNDSYSCNQALFPKPLFITSDINKVTCKNCKRFLKIMRRFK